MKMRIKIYYRVTNPLTYNLVDAETATIDGKPVKEVTHFDNKSILSFVRKDRKLNFELFDIHALTFKVGGSCYSITNKQCSVIVKQNFQLQVPELCKPTA